MSLISTVFMTAINSWVRGHSNITKPSIAQLVERLTVDQMVPGSIPGRRIVQYEYDCAREWDDIFMVADGNHGYGSVSAVGSA